MKKVQDINEIRKEEKTNSGKLSLLRLQSTEFGEIQTC